MAKFSVFGKFFRFWKKKVFHYWKKTSGKQVFQPQKKVTMLGFAKPKPTLTAYFLATFDRGKTFLTVAFFIYGLIYFPFSEKNKIKKLKTLGNRLNHQFHYNTCVNLLFIFQLRPVWSKNIEKWGYSKHFDEKKSKKILYFRVWDSLDSPKKPKF